MTLITAFATDDGVNFIDRHFGDARYYDIYKIDADSAEFLKRVQNTSKEEDEDIHADPEKARSIAGILKKENVNVAVSRIFGPNIKRVRRKFVCILMEDILITEALRAVRKNVNKIEIEWLKGEDRSHIRMKKEADDEKI